MKAVFAGAAFLPFLALIAVASAPPVAEPQVVYTSVGQPVVVELRAMDPEGEPLSFRLTRRPQHGILLGEPPTLIYIPLADFKGIDAFGYEVRDPFDNFDVGVVKIKVEEGYIPLQRGASVRVWRYSGTLRFELGEKIKLQFLSRGTHEVDPVVIDVERGLVAVAPYKVVEEGGYKQFVWDSRELGPGRFLMGIYYNRVLCLFSVVITGKPQV